MCPGSPTWATNLTLTLRNYLASHNCGFVSSAKSTTIPVIFVTCCVSLLSPKKEKKISGNSNILGLEGMKLQTRSFEIVMKPAHIKLILNTINWFFLQNSINNCLHFQQ